MRKLFKIPLLFLFIAACIGLLLRWHLVSPMDWLKYPFWLHAHSHIMFLGWVFNVLYLGYIHSYLEGDQHKRYIVLFIVIQALLAGMLISFPIQGYALFSITFSTLHIIAVVIYCIWFFKDSGKSGPIPSVWFAKYSLIFFLISSIGPFSLAPIMANGLAYTNLYYLAIYFYLHFQYNGVFTFGVLALFFRMLDDKQIAFSHGQARAVGKILFAACFPSYLLSTLWTQPGIWFNLIGAISALLQLVGLFYLLTLTRHVSKENWTKFSYSSKLLMTISLSSLVIKFLLQLLSSHPVIAQIAYEVRYFVIAYLHLVLIGFITFFLIAWYIENQLIMINKVIVFIMVAGFIGSELMMLSIPSSGSLVNSSLLMLFIFSLFISLGFGVLLARSLMLRFERP